MNEYFGLPSVVFAAVLGIITLVAMGTYTVIGIYREERNKQSKA